MDYGLLNRGSLLFGLIACILPMCNIIMQNKVGNRYWGIISIASFSACGISLCLQIFYINHLVNIEDWTAMMDTLSMVSLGSLLLLITTIILNIIVSNIYFNKKY
ncbi:MAG: hypothetical protein ACRDDE_10830 [Paraclostridium sp.]|uniref:hypothetical protein n=1 Tax=Paraclostridium sp. TaxID=2023273 RepID=UPI003EE6B608